MIKKITYYDCDDIIIFERYDHGNGERWCLYHVEETENDWGEPITRKHGYLYNLHEEDVNMLIYRITTEGGYERYSTEYDAE